MEGVNEDIGNWTCFEVLSWLKSTNDGQFDQYIPQFREHQIYGDALLSLTNDILRDEIQIMAYGARHALLKAIDTLKKSYKLRQNKKFQKINKFNKLLNNNKINKINKKHNKIYRKTSVSSVYSPPYSSHHNIGIGIGCSGTLSATYCVGDLNKDNSDTLIHENFENLNTMAKHELINNNDYIKQAKLIVEAVTGTTIKLPIQKQIQSKQQSKLLHSSSAFFKFENKIPNWNNIKIQNAIKYEWNIHTLLWDKFNIKIKIAHNPFSRGSLRVSYYCLELNDCNDNDYKYKYDDDYNDDYNDNDNDNDDDTLTSTKSIHNLDLISRLLGFNNNNGAEGNLIVAKQSIDLTESVKTYFNDVRSQSVAQLFASAYNTYNPPKKIAFIRASVIQLLDVVLDDNSEQFFCIEDYLHGSYRKHLDNYGGDENVRNTPATFAHFTYEASSHKLLVCDIQGVGDLYTDPQIHTYDGKGFGRGNLGIDGMIKFLKTHQCNVICKHLKLQEFNPKPIVYGTRPAKQFMDNQNIKIVKHIHKLNNDKYHKIPKIPKNTLNQYYLKQIYNIDDDDSNDDDNGNITDDNLNNTINSRQTRNKSTSFINNHNKDDNDDDDDEAPYNPLTPLLPITNDDNDDDVEDTNCTICNCIVL